MRCRACGAPNGPASRFCDQCGRRLRPGARPPASSADRRIVSALFADLVDYVRMVAEHDPEDVRQRVDGALAAMAEAVHRYDGTIEKFIGDAVFAVFGYPLAHDDDALRAALCGAAIRDALEQLSHGGEALQVRIGIATGEVVAARRSVSGAPAEMSLTGPAVVNAARIQDLARPGDILLDEATVRAARGRLDVDDRGLELLRGQVTPIHLFALRGNPPTVRPWGPPSGRFIGRTEERARLRAALAATAPSGRGRVVVVAGEAGMGKSRLLAELEPEARAAGFAWSWTENVSYGVGEPYRFIRHFAQTMADEHGLDSGSFVRRLLFTEDVSPEDGRRMAGAIAAVARDADFSGWEAEASYAPTDPGEIVAGVLDVSRRYVERLAEGSGPRVVVVDDFHWADRSSLPMLEQLVTLTSELPFLVLIGTRPSGRPRWADLPHVEWIELHGLDPDETEALATELTGASLGPADGRRLHERTSGNPLFIVEVVRSRMEEGGIVRDGRLAFDDGDNVPLTLRALIGARIDALEDDAREALQVGAVIGITFDAELVGELLGGPVDPAVFGRLSETALVVPTDEPGTWRFLHPLMHDVAYARLLASRRRLLHAGLADRLEAGGRSGIGRIAQHRAASGDRERAVPLLVEAAEEASALGAVSEAARFWRAAADLVGPGTERERYLAHADGRARPDRSAPETRPTRNRPPG